MAGGFQHHAVLIQAQILTEGIIILGRPFFESLQNIESNVRVTVNCAPIFSSTKNCAVFALSCTNFQILSRIPHIPVPRQQLWVIIAQKKNFDISLTDT